jgi:2-polyprenyl-3-methyl-5-hydroxy-6-metoxy-1,4-benzoquinol methylase
MKIFPNGIKFTDNDYEWKSFYEGTIIQTKWKQWIARQVIELVEKPESKALIDIGCGSSPLGLMIGSKEYTGIDENEKKIEYMAQKHNNENRIKYYCTGACYLGQFSPNKFDVALMIEIIEHFHNYREAGRAISEAVRVTKPNGQIIIATPNFRSITGLMMDNVYDVMFPNAYAQDHNIRFGRESLSVLCASEGLKLEKVKSLLGADMVCSFRKE